MGYRERAEAALKDGSAVNRTPEFAKLREENASVTGKMVGCTDVPPKNNKPGYRQYVFETDEGLVKFSLGSNADREFGLAMEIGKVYSIIFLGKEKLPSGNTVNKWNCFEIPSDHEPDPTPEG